MKKFRKTAVVIAITAAVTSLFNYGMEVLISRGSVSADSAYNADVNGDGKVNVMDLNVLKHILFRTEPENEPAEPPIFSDDDSSPLTIICWNVDDSQPMVDLFCKKTGIDHSRIYIKNFNTPGGQASDYYKQYLSDPTNDADILFLEPDWCLEYINDDTETLPLSELGYSESDFSDIYDYIVETGRSTVTGELKGISWQSAAGGYCYRTDLAEQYLGVTNPNEMQAKVKDWDTFLETARELKEAGGPALSATLGGVWTSYSGSRNTAWIDADNKLVIDEYCIDYMKFASELWNNGYVTKASQWTGEWKPLGNADITLGYFIPSWGFGETILTGVAGGEKGLTFGKWNVCIGPSEYYWGGTWLAPSARINNKELAKLFIDFFTINEEGVKAYAKKQSEFMSNKKFVEEMIRDNEYEGAPVLGGQNQFEVLNKIAAGIDVKGKITPYDAKIKEEFSYAASSFCDGTYYSIEEALTEFSENVNELVLK